jgi:hypothetical protein
MMKKTKAQSFLEFALVLPILLLVLMGVVEMTLFIGRYIDLVDLTREAARFASNRDPFKNQDAKTDCSATSEYNFFIDTSCVFSPLRSDTGCTYATFCNGFNAAVPLKFAEDDILISVFTEAMLPDPTNMAVKIPTITDTGQNPWVWSAHDPDTTHADNWRRDCDRLATPQTAAPYFTNAKIQSYMRTAAMPDKGFVTVEVFYCYHQVLNAPIISNFIPNPILIHTYTVMPLPAAQPTATPKPVVIP